MNHEHFEERLALVRAVLAKHDLKPESIAPIDYDEKCPFPYNNFTYKVALATPSPGGFDNANAACTSVPLGDVSSLIVRLSNPNAEGINQANRVQNEVAALFLARRGQAPSVIPAVYDWHARSPDLENDMSWILMEFKTGVGLDQHFEALSETQKAAVIDQIADIFSVVQTAPLPQTVTQHGGLNVGDDGDIVSGEMTTLEGGPWPTYAAFLQTKFASRLKDADQSSALRGWKENGVRERIDAFLTSGLQKRLGDSGVDEMQRVLVHGDLSKCCLFPPPSLHADTLGLSHEQHPLRQGRCENYRTRRF